MAGPFRQRSISPSDYEAIYRWLGGAHASEAWRDERRTGPGRLLVFSGTFVDALADHRTKTVVELEFMADADFVDWEERITAAIRKHGAKSRDDLTMAVTDAGHWAAAARQRAQPLHLWWGPEVPFVSPDEVVARWRKRSRTSSDEP